MRRHPKLSSYLCARFMHLVIDIGNTRTKTGLFRDAALVEQAIWPVWTLDELLAYARDAGADRAIVSSVAAPDETLLDALSESLVQAIGM